MRCLFSACSWYRMLCTEYELDAGLLIGCENKHVNNFSSTTERLFCHTIFYFVLLLHCKHVVNVLSLLFCAKMLRNNFSHRQRSQCKYVHMDIAMCPSFVHVLYKKNARHLCRSFHRSQ